MQLRVLGSPLTVLTHSGYVRLSRQQRQLLAILAVHTGQPVTSARLSEMLWGDGRDHRAALKTLVRSVRLLLPPGRIATDGDGYLLRGGDMIDAQAFHALTALAREQRTARPGDAIALLRRALALWSGPPLDDLPDTPDLHPVRAGLLAARARARTDLMELVLDTGHHADIIVDATVWLAETPNDEVLRRLLMVALYRDGRKAEAWHLYGEGVRTSMETSGAQPGPQLLETAQRIYRDDPTLRWDGQPADPDLPDPAVWSSATGINPAVASAPRVYNSLLGGPYNLPVDRATAAALKVADPGLPTLARRNRAFLRRAVRWAATRGIGQFLDVGAGYPAAGMVHEIAAEITPGARTAYIDHDPSVVAEGSAAVATVPGTVFVAGDARDMGGVFDHPAVAGLLDLTQPVAVLLVTVLHFLPTPDVRRALTDLLARVPSGSCVAVTHATSTASDPGALTALQAQSRASRDPVVIRSYAEIADLLTPLRLVEPGLRPGEEWTPEVTGPPSRMRMYAAIGLTP